MLVIIKVTSIIANYQLIDHHKLVDIINGYARQYQWRKGEEIKECGPFKIPIEYISFRTKMGHVFTIKPKLKKLNYQNLAGVHFYEIEADVICN